MKSPALARLQKLLGVAKTAEASRLARAIAEIAACRGRAALLRGEVRDYALDAAPSGEPLAAADIVAASRWVRRLVERAAAEDIQALALRDDAQVLHKRLARAFARESAATALLDKARIEERRLAARRAEAAMVAPRKAPSRATDQPCSSDSGSIGTSPGSPGIT